MNKELYLNKHSFKFNYDSSIRFLIPFFSYELSSFFSSMANIANKKVFLDIHFVADDEMEGINIQMMKCQGPTNILSFPSLASNQNSIIGELVLAPQTIKREAFFYNQKITKYYQRLIAHGFVHLMGYDHSKEMDELCFVMEASFN